MILNKSAKLICLLFSLIFILQLGILSAAADFSPVKFFDNEESEIAQPEETSEPEIIIDIVEIAPQEIPLTGFFEDPTSPAGCSVLNIILSIITVMGACVMLGGAGKVCNANVILRAVSIIPAVASVAALLFTTNFAGGIIFANGATVLIFGLAAVQAALIAFGYRSAENANQY